MPRTGHIIGCGFSRLLIGVAFMAFGALTAIPGHGQQADPGAETKKVPGSPIGGSQWNTDVQPNQPSGENQQKNGNQLDSEQSTSIKRINDYLNGFTHLQGQFVQLNPNNKKMKGRFFMRRPGKMRFDYARPSRLRIVSNGKYLSIEDHDLKTVDRYPLESTPFRMLLRKNVDLQRDANILALDESENQIAVTLSDKTGNSAGQIKLVFLTSNFALKEWIITDAQGLDTKISVTNLETGKSLDKAFFEPSDIGLANVFEN